VLVDSQAFDDTDCTYPQHDGQAELTWVAGACRWLPIPVLAGLGMEQLY